LASAWLLNAHPSQGCAGSKTDVKDAEWICQLVGHGLVRPSFTRMQFPVWRLRRSAWRSSREARGGRDMLLSVYAAVRIDADAHEAAPAAARVGNPYPPGACVLVIVQ
jgi:hypothetical protein